MQIGSECFKDEQLCYIIESAQKLGRCDITGRDNCFVYDTDNDFYLKEYIEELIDVFTVAKYMGVDEADDRVAYISTFLCSWNVFSVGADMIREIIREICQQRYHDEPELFDEKVTIRELFSSDEMEQKCILKTYSWSDFCYNIKHVNRFHSQQFNLGNVQSG
ncbi:hypothetical protein [Agathobacter sp.]|uniref:hypothetical protein n=1 Tax=Agathobacter sp. TaxID=2021311 RepID=UPI003FD6D657